MSMNDPQLLRYSRHILPNEIGIEGQQRLLEAKVLIIYWRMSFGIGVGARFIGRWLVIAQQAALLRVPGH